MKNIDEKILDIICGLCWVEKEDISIKNDSIDEIGINSVTFVEILSTIEMTFDIEFDDNDYDITRYATLENIIDLVKSKLIKSEK